MANSIYLTVMAICIFVTGKLCNQAQNALNVAMFSTQLA